MRIEDVSLFNTNTAYLFSQLFRIGDMVFRLTGKTTLSPKRRTERRKKRESRLQSNTVVIPDGRWTKLINKWQTNTTQTNTMTSVVQGAIYHTSGRQEEHFRLKEHQSDADKVANRKFTRAQRKESTSELNKSAITDHIAQGKPCYWLGWSRDTRQRLKSIHKEDQRSNLDSQKGEQNHEPRRW